MFFFIKSNVFYEIFLVYWCKIFNILENSYVIKINLEFSFSDK